MILVREEIDARQIIHHPQADGQRSTTYDATVGEIVMEGKSIEGHAFTLPPRGIVWVISKEEFHLPNDITGLATLRVTGAKVWAAPDFSLAPARGDRFSTRMCRHRPAFPA
jgi:deoxycytidine triphosphate deaminase